MSFKVIFQGWGKLMFISQAIASEANIKYLDTYTHPQFNIQILCPAMAWLTGVVAPAMALHA